jgi:hypothetical protein
VRYPRSLLVVFCHSSVPSSKGGTTFSAEQYLYIEYTDITILKVKKTVT